MTTNKVLATFAESVLESKAEMGFTYRVRVRKADGSYCQEETTHNIIPLEGLNHTMSVVFKGVTQVPTWYIGVYEGNYTPNSGSTASTIAAAATECTAYVSPTRVEFNEGAVANGAVDNSLNPADFKMTANKTLYGGFIASASAKGATTGVLISALRFASPKQLEINDTLEITAGNALAST